MLAEAWPYVSHLVDDSIVVTLRDIAQCVRTLVERHSMVTEGAGAAPLAAALSDEIPDGNIVCVLSGGNIDNEKLVTIFDGNVP